MLLFDKERAGRFLRNFGNPPESPFYRRDLNEIYSQVDEIRAFLMK